MIYLDYTSTTPVDEEVLETYLKTQKNFFANPSSLHRLGRESNHMLDIARKDILNTLGLENYKISFTANATEANNLAIFGITNKYTEGKIILSSIEHPSIIGPSKELIKRGFEVVYLDILPNGQIDLDHLARELDKNTILVSVMWVNNIVGSIQPIKEVQELVSQFPKAKLLVDGVQGFTKVEPDFELNKVDMLTLSAHKMYGPKGVGCLLRKDNLDLEPIIFAAKAQENVKPGTLDIALNVSLAKALKKFYPKTKENFKIVKELWDYLYDSFKNNPKVIINSHKQNNSPYIFNISIPSVASETVLRILEAENIYVSAGSACAAKSKKPEPTVYAQTKSVELASHTIRMGLSTLVSLSDLEKVTRIINSL